MELSARNQLKGRVTRIKSGTVRESDEVTVIIKGTDVMIGK